MAARTTAVVAACTDLMRGRLARSKQACVGALEGPFRDSELTRRFSAGLTAKHSTQFANVTLQQRRPSGDGL